jgi:trimethylamine--corrinoid protein Co-methyltransferase
MSTTRGRRSGGRKSRQAQRNESVSAGEIGYRNLRNPFKPVEVLSEDQIQSIHLASLRVLEELGLRILYTPARQIFRDAGAIVDDNTGIVRIGREIIEKALESVSPEITIRARNPLRSVTIGNDHLGFVTVAGPPHVTDLDRGRRAGDLASHIEYTKLSQSFDVVGIIGAAVEPLDVPLPFRHLEQTLHCLLLSDKPGFVWCRGQGVLDDSLEMVRIANQLEREDFINTPCCYSVANVNSPLQLDVPMSHGIMYMAEMGQVMIVTPFTLAGAMAPVTLVGALNQQNAEALAGIALSQLTRPGAPVVYGGFTSNVDMKSGSPAFGTPEFAQGAMITGQLTRLYNIPYRSSGSNASTNVDAQAAYETQMSLWSALMGGCHFFLHAAGWLEGGLSSSYEKFIIDVEMLQMFAEMLKIPEVNEQTLAHDAIREVGPGGHFFGCAHTMSRYEHAFYSPLVSNWDNFENWSEQGALSATQRANRIWKETLENYQAPEIEIGVQRTLEKFVERRKAEGGATIG